MTATIARRGFAALACAAVLSGPLLAGCAGSAGSPGSQDGQNYVAGDGALTILAPDDRGAPVALSGTTVEGDRLDVASLRGAPVVLNVWYAACPPCRKEAPELEKAAQRLKAQGVRFVGINTRDTDPATAAAFQRTFNVGYPSLMGDSTALLPLRGVVAPNAVPSTVVLDAQGRVAARISGATTATTILDVVEDVMAGSGS